MNADQFLRECDELDELGEMSLELPCECRNCRHMRKMREHALRGVMEAVNRNMAVSEHVVFMWNETVKLFPCQKHA